MSAPSPPSEETSSGRAWALICAVVQGLVRVIGDVILDRVWK